MKIVIIGGVAGGASAAARLRRLDEGAEIVLFERGGHISFANCGLPYYTGGAIPDRESLLLQTPASMEARFRVDVRVQTEVLKIDGARKVVSVRSEATGEEYDEPYDKLLISTGASPVRPPFPGADLPEVFTLRNMEDCDRIHDYVALKRPERALVVGGGFIGVEMAENLVHSGIRVSLAEMADQILAPLDYEMACILHRHMRKKGVDLKLGTSLQAVERGEDGLICRLGDGTAETFDMVLLAIGVRADNGLAREAGLELGFKGTIEVDPYMRTSDPDILAVGDVIEVEDYVSHLPASVPLAGPANRQGRLAAGTIAGRPEAYEGTLGTMVCKVFDYTAGATGNNEKQLKSQGRKYDKIYVHPGSHAGYYPGGSTISLKLLFDPDSGLILGAQAVGQEGVDKRIDVIATAMHGRMTVFDLEKLELSYAPPLLLRQGPGEHGRLHRRQRHQGGCGADLHRGPGRAGPGEGSPGGHPHPRRVCRGHHRRRRVHPPGRDPGPAGRVPPGQADRPLLPGGPPGLYRLPHPDAARLPEGLQPQRRLSHLGPCGGPGRRLSAAARHNERRA